MDIFSSHFLLLQKNFRFVFINKDFLILFNINRVDRCHKSTERILFGILSRPYTTTPSFVVLRSLTSCTHNRDWKCEVRWNKIGCLHWTWKINDYIRHEKKANLFNENKEKNWDVMTSMMLRKKRWKKIFSLHDEIHNWQFITLHILLLLALHI